jgi:hypothetical protein
MPSRSPTGDNRRWLYARFESDRRDIDSRCSPAGEWEPTRGSPTESQRVPLFEFLTPYTP